MCDIAYNFYATLLDSFQSYLDSDITWEKFWGGSPDPKLSITEYAEQCKQELIDRINRVPFDSEAADRGTAYNEIVDCLIENRNTDKMKVSKVVNEDGKVTALKAEYKEREFVFPIEMCRDMAECFKGAIPQYYCEAVLPTKYGNVKLYGYIDELMPTKIHDIKTTGSYSAFKFRRHWQHYVYPYCLQQMGSDVTSFEYDVVVFGKSLDKYDFFAECYNFIPHIHAPQLTEHCERLIEFINANRELITDKKIFNNGTE